LKSGLIADVMGIGMGVILSIIFLGFWQKEKGDFSP
jgi:hypothetical protein